MMEHLTLVTLHAYALTDNTFCSIVGTYEIDLPDTDWGNTPEQIEQPCEHCPEYTNGVDESYTCRMCTLGQNWKPKEHPND